LHANENLFGTAFLPIALPAKPAGMFGLLRKTPDSTIIQDTIRRALAAAPDNVGRYPVKPFRRDDDDPYSADW